MGKKDGFVYEQQANRTLRPKERIRNFDEFHPRLPDAERRRQAARCMNYSGVPLCQSGAAWRSVYGYPLHNPRVNDMLYLGNARHALDPLSRRTVFPEFTGRVCPALCEAACTCGLNGNSVTVREHNKLHPWRGGDDEGLDGAARTRHRTSASPSLAAGRPASPRRQMLKNHAAIM